MEATATDGIALFSVRFVITLGVRKNLLLEFISITQAETIIAAMGVFEVIKLIGACVAFILGTIVFMVLFFRGMSWIDFWVRGRRVADDKRKRLKHVKDSKHSLHDQKQQAVALEERKPLPTMKSVANLAGNTPANTTTLRWSSGIGSVHGSKLASMPHAATADTTETELESTQPTNHPSTNNESGISVESVEPKVETSRPPKVMSCIATVHLLSGETIERVAFCSKEKVSKICDGLGFEGVVLEDSEGHICVVRESNIKMVTWKSL